MDNAKIFIEALLLHDMEKKNPEQAAVLKVFQRHGIGVMEALEMMMEVVAMFGGEDK